MKDQLSWKLALYAVVAFGLVAAFATGAAAQNPFIIDGVVPANGTPTGPTLTLDPFGSVKELGPVNSNATKVGVIHLAAPPMLAFTNPNGQVDLRGIWMQSAKASNDDLWLYFAWERDANTGSGFIAYEFQQAALSPSCVYTVSGIDMILPESAAETVLINSCNPWSNRQAGDFLILWDQTGSGLNIIKRVFTLAPNGSLVLGPAQPLGSAVVAISADGFRGEAAINLTTDVFPQDGACVNFANIIPGTVTGNSDTADYKDTVLALFQPISNCGIVTVTKAVTPSEYTGSFPYTLKRADGSQIRFDGTASFSQTLTHNGDSTGSPITQLIAGNNYTLSEATQTSPWVLVSIICTIGSDSVNVTSGGTFRVEEGQTTACTITNRRLRGSVQVIKHVVNDNGGTATAGDFTITLGDTAGTTFAGAEGGGVVYTFDEGYGFSVAEIGGPLGYSMVSMLGTCYGAIVADTTQICTITNDDQPGHLTVIKHVVNDNGGTATADQWTMNVLASNPSQSAFPGAEAGVTIALDAGAFSVSESGGPSGYVQTGAAGCVGTIAVGESKTCTITNDDQRPQLTVIKVVVNDNGGTATADQWTMNVTATNPSQASFAGAAAPGVTISLDAGAFSVAESGGPGGYAQTGAEGCAGTIAVGESRTCTITNDDEKANPTGATVQRAILHDALTISDIRAGSPGPAAAVTFRLYADAACSTLVGAEGPVAISLSGTTGTATTVNGILVSASATTVYYWTAEYTGDQFNNGFTTACGSETVTVKFVQ